MAEPVYRIHPAIGIARVGNADRDKYFIGSEFPGFGATGVPNVSDYKSGGLIRPQAARFRIWEYVENKGKLEPKREIMVGSGGCMAINWKVHLANRKASFFRFDKHKGLTVSPAPRRNDSINDRRKLEIDPLPRSISGRDKGPVEFRAGNSSNPARESWPDPSPSPAIDYLGELRTDGAGRLVVIGGKGIAGSWPGQPLNSTFNNDGWFDDISDGPVTAEVVMRDDKNKQKTFQADGAWLLCGPPDFAPALRNVVSLYDLLFDMAAREMTLDPSNGLYATDLKPLWDINADFKANSGSKLTSYKPDFDLDIYPILLSALHYIYVFEPLAASHITFYLKMMPDLGDPDPAKKPGREGIFNVIRKPGEVGLAPGRMPKLNGDEWNMPASPEAGLSVTRTQYAMLERWRDGQFVKTGRIYPPVRPNWMSDLTPHGMDIAALECCVGGAFAPGIEVSWQIRDARLFSAPFRIDHGAPTRYLGDVGAIRAGHFSRQMAVPWHTDFRLCKIENNHGWWPVQRPDVVYLNDKAFRDRLKGPTHLAWTRPSGANWPSGGQFPTAEEFVANYYKLGFVREDPKDYFVERERAASVP